MFSLCEIKSINEKNYIYSQLLLNTYLHVSEISGYMKQVTTLINCLYSQH